MIPKCISNPSDFILCLPPVFCTMFVSHLTKLSTNTM